jgi:hypothetical protein
MAFIQAYSIFFFSINLSQFFVVLMLVFEILIFYIDYLYQNVFIIYSPKQGTNFNFNLFSSIAVENYN